MKRTYIFNPEHDLALAYGSEGYTALPLAQQLRRDLQMLPAWYCTGDAEVLSQNADEDARWLQLTRHLHGSQASPVAINRLQRRHSAYYPWGWDLDLRGRLLNACVDAADLPSRRQVLKVQELSHRRTSTVLHHLIRQTTGITFSPIPVEVGSVAEIRAFNELHPQCYIKAPWSGSGKGIYRVLDAGSRNFETWAQGIINRQGSIMCEEPLEKVLDFAMEFRCHDGKAEFAGYSVFNNDAHCSFDSGVVASQWHLREIITSALGSQARHEAMVREVLPEILGTLITPHYDGYVGIDMMVYNDGGTMRLNPCVEINLRMTMGVVATSLATRLAPGTTATFRVTYHRSPQELQSLVDRLTHSQPILMADQRIAAGFVPLTPIYAESRFLAQLIATNNDNMQKNH